jgi:threonine/homoserine/homoserine lactone efflux protein
VPTLLAHVLAFAGAALLLAMAPGPATATLLRQTIRHGRRRGAATVAGIESGVLFWAVAASAGLSALLAASVVAYDVIRVVGAIVLIALGAQALFRSRKEQDDTGVDAEGSPPSPPAGRGGWSAYRAGLVTNLANPKAGVFAISFLPPDVLPRRRPAAARGTLGGRAGRLRRPARSGVALIYRSERQWSTVKAPSKLSQAIPKASMIRSPTTHGHGRIDLLP